MSFTPTTAYFVARAATEYSVFGSLDALVRDLDITGKSILEMGSRDGRLLRAFDNRHSLHGVEIMGPLVEETRRVVAHATVYPADPHQFDPLLRYDAIISMHDPTIRRDSDGKLFIQSSLGKEKLIRLLTHYAEHALYVLLGVGTSSNRCAADFSYNGTSFTLVREEKPSGLVTRVGYSFRMNGSVVMPEQVDFKRYPIDILDGRWLHIIPSGPFFKVCVPRSPSGRLQIQI